MADSEGAYGADFRQLVKVSETKSSDDYIFYDQNGGTNGGINKDIGFTLSDENGQTTYYINEDNTVDYNIELLNDTTTVIDGVTYTHTVNLSYGENGETSKNQITTNPPLKAGHTITYVFSADGLEGGNTYMMGADLFTYSVRGVVTEGIEDNAIPSNNFFVFDREP